MSGWTVEVHELRPELADATRSLILSGLGEHWGHVDPALNRDLDDLAAIDAAGSVLVACIGEHVVGTGAIVPRGETLPRSCGCRSEVVEFYLRCGFTQTHFQDGEFGRDAWFEMRFADQVETGDDTGS